ncbi:MAG: hypothetical protein JWN73_1408 [Betaproteobacteria bacterium]|nr:hypothetical protein [Betaproteobacteria bacterium]
MTIARKSLAWLVVLALFALGGCANVPKQAYNRAANQDIKRVAILKPPVIKEFVVQNFGHPGMAFGLIGGLIAAADMSSKTGDFTTKMKTFNFDPGAEFTAKLAEELRACGYEVSVLEVARPKPEILKSYDGLDAAPDAYIDVVLNWSGYFTSSPTADYVPAMRALVRVVRRQSKEIAYQELINYGYEMRVGQSINLTAEGKYNFGNFSALMADPDRALEGMRYGIPLIARQVGRDLAPEGYVAPPLLATPATGTRPATLQPVSQPAAPSAPAAGAQPQETVLKPQ